MVHRPQPEGPDVGPKDDDEVEPEPQPERGNRPAEEDGPNTQPIPKVE